MEGGNTAPASTLAAAGGRGSKRVATTGAQVRADASLSRTLSSGSTAGSPPPLSPLPSHASLCFARPCAGVGHTWPPAWSVLRRVSGSGRSRDGGAGTEHEATLVPPENCEACAVPLRTAGRGGGDSIVAITSSTSIALGARAENITAWPAAHGRDLIRGCTMRVGARTRAHALAPYSA